MLEEIKLLLGEAADNYTEAQISLAYKLALAEVENYCNREVGADVSLKYIVEQIAVIKLNRTNTEGLASQAYSGISEAYINGYPAEILAALNRKRKLKVI